MKGYDTLPPTIYRKASPLWKEIDDKVWKEVPRERESIVTIEYLCCSLGSSNWPRKTF